MKPRIAVLISGGGSNMVKLLESMDTDHPAEPCLVMANSEQAGGLAKARALGVATDFVDHKPFGEDRAAFLAETKAKIVVLDIPLIFETGGDKRMDAVACVTVSADIQQKRVMARGTMTLEQFENIRAKQMPNDEKCALADYVIETDTLPHARAQVEAVIEDIKGKLSHA